MRIVIHHLLPFCVVASLWRADVLIATGHEGAALARGVGQNEDDPTRGSKDVDRVLPHPLDATLQAAKRAVTTYGCEIKKEESDSFECTRSRHIGVLVGSGGEKVTIRLQAVDDGTRVSIKTGKGFVGRLGKKNWSTPIFNELLAMLEAS